MMPPEATTNFLLLHPSMAVQHHPFSPSHTENSEYRQNSSLPLRSVEAYFALGCVGSLEAGERVKQSARETSSQAHLLFFPLGASMEDRGSLRIQPPLIAPAACCVWASKRPDPATYRQHFTAEKKKSQPRGTSPGSFVRFGAFHLSYQR